VRPHSRYDFGTPKGTYWRADIGSVGVVIRDGDRQAGLRTNRQAVTWGLKVLDCGLAKALQLDPEDDPSQSPTLT